MAGVCLAWPTRGADAPRDAESQRGLARQETTAGSSATRQRLREGSRLEDVSGSFKSSGDRVLFITTDGERYVALENLQLDRAAHRVADSPDEIVWSVSGVVTEYGGGNYLLLSRAVQRSKD